MTWRQFFAAGQRQLPHTATFRERGQLTKRLAAEWRAGHRHKRNPGLAGMDNGKLATFGLIGAAVFVGAKWLEVRQLPPPVPFPPSEHADMNWDPVRNCYSGLDGACLPRSAWPTGSGT